jgi:hypothetical protein
MTEVGGIGKQFSVLARSIAARRDSGVLVYTSETTEISFLFYQGKLVDGRRDRLPLADQIAERMRQAGYEIHIQSQSYEDLTNEQLIEYVESQGYGLQLVRFFLEHVLMDYIFDLQSITEGECRFDPRVVSFNRDIAPALTIGRILLDIVALQEDPLLNSQAYSSSSIVKLLGSIDRESLCQSIIKRVLDRGECSIESLRKKSGISQFEFQETLKEMIATGTIELMRHDGVAVELVATNQTSTRPVRDTGVFDSSEFFLSSFSNELLASDALPKLLHQLYICLVLAGLARGLFTEW